jgi:cytochrome c peroxidase
MTSKNREEIENCFDAIDVMRQNVLNIIEMSALESVDLDDDDAVNKILDKIEYKSQWLAAWVDKGSDKFNFKYDKETKQFSITFKR